MVVVSPLVSLEIEAVYNSRLFDSEVWVPVCCSGLIRASLRVGCVIVCERGEWGDWFVGWFMSVGDGLCFELG